jgi:hypothetical protein
MSGLSPEEKPEKLKKSLLRRRRFKGLGRRLLSREAGATPCWRQLEEDKWSRRGANASGRVRNVRNPPRGHGMLFQGGKVFAFSISLQISMGMMGYTINLTSSH